MDVTRVQAGFAAVPPRPLGLGTDQAHAGAGGVVVNFVGGRQQDFDVGLGEEIGRAVRAVEHADLPFAGQRGLDGGGGAQERSGVGDAGGRGAVNAQHVTGAQGAAGVAAEQAEGKSGLAAEVIRYVKTVADGEVGAQAGAVDRADAQRLAGADTESGVGGDRFAVEGGGHVRAGEGNDGGGVETQRRAVDG